MAGLDCDEKMVSPLLFLSTADALMGRTRLKVEVEGGLGDPMKLGDFIGLGEPMKLGEPIGLGEPMAPGVRIPRLAEPAWVEEACTHLFLGAMPQFLHLTASFRSHNVLNTHNECEHAHMLVSKEGARARRTTSAPIHPLLVCTNPRPSPSAGHMV